MLEKPSQRTLLTQPAWVNGIIDVAVVCENLCSVDMQV